MCPKEGKGTFFLVSYALKLFSPSLQMFQFKGLLSRQKAMACNKQTGCLPTKLDDAIIHQSEAAVLVAHSPMRTNRQLKSQPRHRAVQTATFFSTVRPELDGHINRAVCNVF